MSNTSLVYRWITDRLELLDYCDLTDSTIVVADSWLVGDRKTLALDLHRQRFAATAGDIESFWAACLELVPETGGWFPRVEKHDNGTLLFRLRSSPERARSVVLATTPGDPRTQPTIKGPDLATMLRLRTEVQSVGAGEAVILSPDGYVVEGAYSALVWWRGSILCYPSEDLERIDSVTARSLIGLATALGVDTFAESVTPAELDGTELWTLNALHGPRIVTAWVDGPSVAELPGRLELWRKRLAALRR